MSKNRTAFDIMQKTIKKSKMYGNQIREVFIFSHDDEQCPCLEGTFTYDTGANPGIKQLTYEWLQQNDRISKDREKDYYKQVGIKIWELSI